MYLAIRVNYPWVVTVVAVSVLFVHPSAGQEDPLTEVREQLDDPNFQERLEAVKTLTRFGNRGVPLLKKQLSDQKIIVRAYALQSLKQIGTGDAVRAMAVALDDPNGQVRQKAYDLLEDLGPDAKPVVPVLIEKLKNKNIHGEHPFRLLGKIGPGAKEAVPFMIRAACRNPIYIRSIAKALIQIRPPAISRLIERTADHRSPFETILLIEGLTSNFSLIHPARKSVIKYIIINGFVAPELIKFLEGKNKNVRKAVISHLGRIRPVTGTGISELHRCFRQAKEEEVRLEALKAIRRIGTRSEKVISSLVNTLKTTNSQRMKRYLAYTLSVLGRDSERVVPYIKKLLRKTEDRFILRMLISYCPEMGRRAGALLPVVQELPFQSDNRRIRLNSVSVLVFLGKYRAFQPEVVEVLRKVLDMKDELLVQVAVKGLRDIGAPAAVDAIPALQKLTESDNEKLRSAARQAIQTIRKQMKKK